MLGVDVDAGMAEFARRGGIEVEVAKFEHWDPAGRRFDAVIAGQTWHWVDPVAGALRAAEVLRPGGRQRWEFDWERSYTRGQWLDQVPTSGGHAVGGSLAMRYVAVALSAGRLNLA